MLGTWKKEKKSPRTYYITELQLMRRRHEGRTLVMVIIQGHEVGTIWRKNLRNV
jgi:hypothetical protein